MCDGFWLLDVPPSPKVQRQAATLPSGSLLPSLKSQLSPLQLGEKDAVGDWLAGVTVTDLLVTSVAPLSSVTVSRTVYVPPAP